MKLPIFFLLVWFGKCTSINDSSKYFFGQFNFNGVPVKECLNESSIPLAENADKDFLYKTRLWYITGGTTYHYKILGKILLGRDVRDQQELEKMCLSASHGDILLKADCKASINGYAVTFQYICQPTDTFGNITCQVDTDPATYDWKFGVNPTYDTAPANHYLVKTDNRHYTIWYGCINGFADVMLKTTGPYVSQEIANIYNDVMMNMSINPRDVQLLRCSPEF